MNEAADLGLLGRKLRELVGLEEHGREQWQEIEKERGNRSEAGVQEAYITKRGNKV